MNQAPSFEQIIDIQGVITQMQIQFWLKHEFLTIQFWILLATLVLPWFLWFKLIDKKRFIELLAFSLLVHVFVTILDEVGCQLNLWDYRYDIEPLFPRLLPVNMSVLPVLYSLVYQYIKSWKAYIIANVIFAAFLSFTAENLMIFLHIYAPINWKHIYSFPIYFALAILFKALFNLFIKIQKRHS